MIHASCLVAISTNVEGVQVTKTSKSAIERFSKNKFVDLPSFVPPVSLLVRITMITSKFPSKPTANMIVRKTKLIVAVYSGRTLVVLSLSELVVICVLSVADPICVRLFIFA